MSNGGKKERHRINKRQGYPWEDQNMESEQKTLDPPERKDRGLP